LPPLEPQLRIEAGGKRPRVHGQGFSVHRRSIAPRLAPRNSSSSEPCRPSSGSDPTLAKQQHGFGQCVGRRISASAPIRSQAGPNRAWPRSTRAKLDRFAAAHPLAQQRGLAMLHPLESTRKPCVADDQPERHRIEAEDQRPFLHHDVQQMVEVGRIHRGEHRLVDGRDRARLAAREGEQVFARLFGRRDPRPQPRQRMILEGEELSHAASVCLEGLTSSGSWRAAQPIFWPIARSLPNP
jgi:hypothetical protein